MMKKILLLTSYFLLISLLFLHPINSGDFFHHLNTGRYVVNHHSLPYVDDLSFTAYGKSWVAHSWGAGVIFYFVYETFGPDGISILFSLLGTLAGFFLFLSLNTLLSLFAPKQRAVNLLYSLVFVWLAASLISLRWPTRPEVLAPLFVMVLIYLLMHFKKRFMPIVLPFFFWLWGIIYGSSAFLGIAILLFYLIVNKQFNKRGSGIFTASLVASLLNGYGLKSFLYIFQIPAIVSYVGEWLPLHKTLNAGLVELTLFYQYIVLCYLLFVALYLVTTVWAFITRRQLLLGNIFLWGISLAIFAPFYTNRFVNLAPLLVAPILGLAIYLASRKARYVLFSLAILLASITTTIRFHQFTFGFGLEPNPFQTKVTDFLRAKRVSGNIFASQEIGAFLSWELPDAKVFVDTRDDLYQPLGIFEELRLVAEGKVSLLDILKKYDANIVVGDLGSAGIYKPFFYTKEWSLVYLTDGFFVSVKTDLANQYQLPKLMALDPTRVPPAKPGELEKAEEELQALLQSDPASMENNVRLVETKLAQDKPNEARSIIESLDLSGYFGSRQVIVDMESALLKGRVYLANKECDKALAFFNQADKLSRKKFIFFPSLRLPTTVDRYLGEYYLACTTDKAKAKKYLLRYLRQTTNPIEKREVEKKLPLSDN